jgi:NitT/TauT family transport system ATP-binding protein
MGCDKVIGSSGKAKLEARHVRKEFGTGAGKVLAIDDVSFPVRDREFCVIVGPSGCGKSTLLYLAAGFEKPTSGEILLNGATIQGPGPDRGFVFQEFALYPWKTVLGNVSFGLEIQGMDGKEAKERAEQYIEAIGLAGFETAYPHTLSGGMKQRVGIARALAYDPEILLMDEPFGSLDAQTKKLMQRELLNVWAETKKTVLYVTHSVVEAAYLADKVVVLTARPSTVKGIVEIDLPRPRSYTDEGYLRAREKILGLLDEEVARAFETETSGQRTLEAD